MKIFHIVFKHTDRVWNEILQVIYLKLCNVFWDNIFHLQIYETSAIKVNTVRLEVLERWHRKGGVAIVGYDMFRRLVNARGKGRKLQERLRKVLLDPGKCFAPLFFLAFLPCAMYL